MMDSMTLLLDLYGLLFSQCVRRLMRIALGTCLLGLTSCAVRDYSPPLLPTFMQEQTPAGVTPPVGHDALDDPFTRTSRGVLPQTVLAPPEPSPPISTGALAPVHDASQLREPPPTSPLIQPP